MAAPKSIPHDPPEPPIDPRIRASDERLAAAVAILAHPDEEISEEILDQARQKLWYAFTGRLKIFADARGWDYCENSITRELLGRIDDALGTGLSELSGSLASAELVYYGGCCPADDLDPDEVRHRLPIFRSLCTLLDDAHRTLPLDLTPPDSIYYRAAAERCAERRAKASVAD